MKRDLLDMGDRNGVVVPRVAVLCLLWAVCLSACRPPLTFPLVRPEAANTPTSTPDISPTATDEADVFAGDPPGPVLTISDLPDGELLVGVGPVGNIETGFEWQVWRGLDDDWQQLTWPPEAIPLSLYSTAPGQEIYAVPFSQATYGPGQAWGVMRSDDAGGSWRQILTGLGDPYVMALSFSPHFTSDRTLYAATWYSGVFRSADAGDNWEPVPYTGQLEPSGGASPFDLAVAVSPNYAVSPQDGTPASGMVMASFGRGLHRWRAGADSWETSPMTVTTPLKDFEPESAPVSARAIAFSPDFATDKTIYVYSGFAGMLRSVDAGESWTLVNRWLPEPMPLEVRTSLAAVSAEEAYALLPEVSNGEQAGVDSGETVFVLYRTLDGGMTWQALQDAPTWGYVSAFQLSRTEDGVVSLLLGGSQGGVTVSLADELSWD